MQDELPFYENPEESLTACVQALGGAKKVGAKLFPDKTVDNARDYLLACLNSTRSEKLGYTQIIYVFREAKQIGFHAGFEWWSRSCEYEARPITKAEEVDRLTTVVEQASKTLAVAAAALERIHSTQNPPYITKINPSPSKTGGAL